MESQKLAWARELTIEAWRRLAEAEEVLATALQASVAQLPPERR